VRTILGPNMSLGGDMRNEQKRRITTSVVDVGAMAGESLDDRFQLVRRVGEGGYGAVFEAVQLSVERTCAVKVLASRLGADEVSRRRFHVEAKATAELTHPHTVTLFDFGVDDTTGVLFLAMEMLDGPTLQAVVSERGLLPARAAVSILEAIAGSLQEAHDKGLVHRDIKPNNLICTDVEALLGPEYGGHVPVKLIDFGIAKTVSAEGSDAEKGIVSSGGLTRTGMMVGTPTYMSPEQIRGEEVDGRVDQYALAMTAYWLVTGRTPYAGSTALEVASRHLTEPALPLTSYRPQLQVPPAFEDVLLKALSKEPSERFESIEAFAAACVSTLSWGESDQSVVLEELDSEGRESVETATIREDEARRTPQEVPGPMTDETERTRVVSGKEDEQSDGDGGRWQAPVGERRYFGRRGSQWAWAMIAALRRVRWKTPGAVGVSVLVVGVLVGTGWGDGASSDSAEGEVSSEAVPRVRADVEEEWDGWVVQARGLVGRAIWAGRLESVTRRLRWSEVGWLGTAGAKKATVSEAQPVQPRSDSTDARRRSTGGDAEKLDGPGAEAGVPSVLSVRMIPWGTLYVDGEKVDQGVVAQTEVEPGRHRVVVRQGKKVVKDVMIEVVGGERQEVEFRLD
jgi:serine/threonine protein kinase